MQIIIGGSGSTGSSLLKNILGRHPDIFASQEMSLFTKKALYADWQKNKKRIFNKKWTGLKTYGFHRYAQVDFYLEELGVDHRYIAQAIDQSTSLPHFVDRLFAPALHHKGANHWLEKTPANSCLFHDFLDAFDEGIVIHTVRHPLDTLASLVARGFDAYYAVGVYLINAALGLSVRGHDRYLEVKYEDLVRDPASVIGQLCASLSLPFYPQLLHPGQEEYIKVTKLKGWNYDETEAVNQGSVNRFNTMSSERQAEIETAAASIQLNEVGKEYFSTSINTISEIASILGYDITLQFDKGEIKKLKKYRHKDWFIRMKYQFPFAFKGFPLDIK